MYSVAANIFGAVKIVLYRRTQTLPVRTLYEALIEYCERNEIDFNRKTPDFKRRDMLIVNKTVNEVCSTKIIKSLIKLVSGRICH